MSLDSAVTNGQPVTYWIFRNLVSAVQILVIVLAFAGCALWALTDDNALKVWAEYTVISTAVSEWSQQLPLPWG